jgi:hypothetical protein
MSRISRRTVLRGLLGGAAVTVGLPALDCWLNTAGTAWADGSAFPRRLGVFWWGNGNIPSRWTPAGTGFGDAWQLSEQLAPLAAHKDKLAVLTGLEVRVPNVVPHFSGAAGMLTGQAEKDVGDDWTAAGPSFDQVVASAIGGSTRFRSLEFGPKPASGLSFTGPLARNPFEASPVALFERLFGVGFVAPGEDPIEDPTLPLRRSVLDAVITDIRDLKGRVGAADSARLDQHFSGIRDLELRIARLLEDPPNLAACTRPAAPPDVFEDLVPGEVNLRAVNQAFAELVAMALACDQTRVFFEQYTYPVSNVLFPGASDGHHNLTHDEPGDQPEVHAITVQCMEGLADLLTALRSVPEGDGTLLDNCAVVGTSEVSLGRTHSLDDFPLLVAGGCCGLLQTDMHYRSETAESISKPVLSVIRAMGVLQGSWGAEDAATGDGLSALEV